MWTSYGLGSSQVGYKLREHVEWSASHRNEIMECKMLANVMACERALVCIHLRKLCWGIFSQHLWTILHSHGLLHDTFLINNMLTCVKHILCVCIFLLKRCVPRPHGVAIGIPWILFLYTSFKRAECEIKSEVT